VLLFYVPEEGRGAARCEPREQRRVEGWPQLLDDGSITGGEVVLLAEVRLVEQAGDIGVARPKQTQAE